MEIEKRNNKLFFDANKFCEILVRNDRFRIFFERIQVFKPEDVKLILSALPELIDGYTTLQSDIIEIEKKIDISATKGDIYNLKTEITNYMKQEDRINELDNKYEELKKAVIRGGILLAVGVVFLLILIIFFS